MQTIGKLGAAQAEYYTKQLRHSVGEDVPVVRGERWAPQVDYYAAHESPSRWMGAGLERLRLRAGREVEPENFAKLMGHQTPSDASMTVTRTHGKVAAFDHTFSAPKSVSLLYAFGDDRTRTSVISAHQRAVAEALQYMEERCSQSRLGVRFRDEEGNRRFTTRTLESEGYIAAAFDHFTSRASDPQVHTHVVIINRVWAGEGWRALDAKRAYAHAKAGGTVYQSVLRAELTRQLGVEWQPVVNGVADVAGFSPELIRHFSTRRTEILAAVERYVAQVGGESHPRVWQAFTLETRQPKAYPTGDVEVIRQMKDYGITQDVVDHWQRRALDASDDVVDVVRRVVGHGRPALVPTHDEIREGARELVEWVSDRHAVFTERDLVSHVSSLFPDGTNPHDLVETTQQLLAVAQDAGDVLRILPHAEPGLLLPEGVTLTADELDLLHSQGSGWIQQNGSVRFRALPGEARYTTRVHLEREARVLEAVTLASPVAPDHQALECEIGVRELVEGQADAVRRLAELNGRVVAVVGPGGSGKTYSIGAYAEAVATAGHLVIGVATSAAAARKLGEDLGDRWTGTIAMLRHHLDASPYPLRLGTLIVVDESSMVSTRDLAWLVEKVDECDGKLVLVGDPKQLPSVDSGGLFHRIVASGEQVVDKLIDVNQRQQLDLDRAVLDRLRTGETERAVYDYAEADRLHLGRDEYPTKAAMVDAWWADVKEHGLDGVRMLASRHDEVQMLNELARVRMHEGGELSGTVVVNRWGTEFQAGDRIVVRDNWYAHADLRNGQTGSILSVDPASASVTFRRDLDGEVIQLPRRYLDSNVDHAYAQTIHTAQGQTFQRAHVYADTGVRAEHGYTALSRAREKTHLWVNDAPGPLGECTHIHGDPLTDDRVAALARQLSQSVIEPTAYDQGLPVASATDRQLIEWRDELESTIRRSPMATDPSDKIVALDAAVAEARETAERLGTSGARAQARVLKLEKTALDEHVKEREVWLVANAPALYRYSAVRGEISHRVNARVAAYELSLPEEVLRELGEPPADVDRRRQWTAGLAGYAEVRMAVEGVVDAHDPAIVRAPGRREAVAEWSWFVPEAEDPMQPVRRAM
jgi:conjugative relaxase-like TrwC/TraI family protein